MMRVRYIRILGLFVTPICSAHCVAHAVCLAAVKTVNAFFDHLHFVVCRSYSNTTDYGGDNFDDGHSEQYSVSSDHDVSFISMSRFIFSKTLRRYVPIWGLSYHLFFVFR